LFVEGPAADEEPLEIPRMDAKLAQNIDLFYFYLAGAYSHAQLFMLLETLRM
jgi:hypothetical protein